MASPTSSRGSQPQMPVIAEDDNSPVPSPKKTGPLPRFPLRVPQKTYRPSARPHRPRPFVPLPHPLSEKYAPGSTSPAASNDPDNTEDLLRQLDMGEKHSFTTNRRRTLRLLLVVAAIALVIVALSVGLGVGLTKRGSANQGAAEDISAKTEFPAGDYTFSTTLDRTATACTSNPSTWRCYPYKDGGSAKFFWVIQPPDQDKSNYTVSSTDNPFAPSFSNISMSHLDLGSPDERLVFSFDTDRKIVPGQQVDKTNRAAVCAFDDTRFEATLWTRRKGNKPIDLGSSDSSKYGDWPGDLEVRQVKEAELGSPRCEDASGNAIADVQAGAGDCVCEYSNFDNDDK